MPEQEKGLKKREVGIRMEEPLSVFVVLKCEVESRREWWFLMSLRRFEWKLLRYTVYVVALKRLGGLGGCVRVCVTVLCNLRELI